MGIALTRDQHFVLVNPRFESMFGWPPGLVVGHHGSVVWASAAEHLAVGRDLGPALARGEQIEVERQMTRRDGSVFMCRILAKALSPTEPGRGGTLWLRARLHVVLTVGQGQWEDTTGAMASTVHMAGLLRDQGVRVDLDMWGHDVAHDWPWWQRQACHHVPRFC